MGGEQPERTEAAQEPVYEEGGDPVCWAHLVCPECGAIESEGHRAGCDLAPRAPNQAQNPR
jgi:hypothetical protein